MFELSEQDIEVGCITLERQRIVDGVPIFYDISYLPNINLPRFTRKSFENRSLFNILRTSYGIEVIGDLLARWEEGGDKAILAISGIGRKILADTKKLLRARGYEIPEYEAE